MLQKFRPKPPIYPPKPWQRQHDQRRPASLPVGSYGGGRAPSLDRRARVYRAIVEYAKEHGGNSPSHRQIQEMAGISSTSVVAYNIAALVDDGLLEIKDRKVVVVGAQWIAPAGTVNK